MKDSKKLVNELIKENKIKILISILVYSFVSVLISMIFQKLNLVILGFLPTTILIFIYLVSLLNYTNRIVNGEDLSIKDMFKKQILLKTHFIMLVIYIGWALLAFILLLTLGKNPNLIPLIFLMLLLILVLSNAFNSTYYFLKENGIKNTYLFSLKVVLKDKKLLLSNAIKTITIMIVGSILTVLVNIFAFGPELSVLLDRTDDKSTDLIKMIFSNDISTIIQSVGVLTIIYYVLFVSFITYAVYISANSLKIKKLSTS